jgi:hypothetical protein
MIEARDLQTRQDPEIVRLAALADKAEGEGAIQLALRFRDRASRRADEIDRALDEAEANIAGRRMELAATYRSNADTAAPISISPRPRRATATRSRRRNAGTPRSPTR